MCGCEWNYQCAKCSGDPRQDWRLQFAPDPAEDRDDAERAADLATHLDEVRRAA